MSLLIKSIYRHMRKHWLQTILTMLVTILLIGMLAVLFCFASSFQQSLRMYALEENGDYHYKYSAYTGSGAAELFREMKTRFAEDDWFRDVELIEDDSQVYLILTAAHPGLFTTRTMNEKFESVKNACYEESDEVFNIGTDHNCELLASCGDLSKENGIYSFLLVFLLLLIMIAVAAILTLSSVFWVSAMQREREIALLSGIGAVPHQIIGMILIESFVYCLASIPLGYFLGVLMYQNIQKHIDNIIYSLFQFPPADLVISVSFTVALSVCTVCIILLSGVKSAVKISRISPIKILHRTGEIQIKKKERGKSNIYDDSRIINVESWLAKKSYRRYKRRNRPTLIMLAVTIILCFVLNGFSQYAMEVMEMTYGTMTYNFSVDLYSEEKTKLGKITKDIQRLSDNQLMEVKEAVFCLHSPYPFSEFGESCLRTNGGMLPDVSLLCIDEKCFRKICSELGISEDTNGIWGIFINTERSWWSDGINVKGKPFEVKTGDQLQLYDSSEPSEEEEKTAINIAGVYDKPPAYTEVTESCRMQILVPQEVFDQLETKRPYLDSEPGTYHISLRGNIENCNAFEKEAKEQLEEFSDATYFISNYEEEIQMEKSSIDSFEFLCRALIAIFVFICVCGNFTISWAINTTREREYATLESIGMRTGEVRKMRLFELLHNVLYVFLPGVLAGVCSYQLIYRIYTSEYQISWRFPFSGLMLGIVTLLLFAGATELALRVGSGKKSLSDRLREEM